MADTPEVKVRFAAEGEAGVTAAVRELSAQLRLLKQTEVETAASAKKLATAEQQVA